LEGIKSNFVIQNIFSFTSQVRKFELVKYNKNLQKKLDINLIDYKNLSGKYIVYEEIGKGKEYNWNDELLFEGEYLNGKRWNEKRYVLNNNITYILKEGKGYFKEYNNEGELRFKGEYLNGDKNGKGKEYNRNGDKIFEGEYLNGKKWNGKGYDANNNIAYILKEGKGYFKEYDCFNGKLVFEGEYLNGNKNGKGKELIILVN